MSKARAMLSSSALQGVVVVQSRVIANGYIRIKNKSKNKQKLVFFSLPYFIQLLYSKFGLQRVAT